MMRRYSSLTTSIEAQAVEDTIRAAIDGPLRTMDMGGSAGIVEAGDVVAKQLPDCAARGTHGTEATMVVEGKRKLYKTIKI
jgi:hypothetical protein